MTLVTPLWAHSKWFPDFLALHVVESLKLPPYYTLLKQSHLHRFHTTSHTLNLHPWRLFIVCSVERYFTKGCTRDVCLYQDIHSRIYQGKLTIFHAGVVAETSLQSVPLFLKLLTSSFIFTDTETCLQWQSKVAEVPSWVTDTKVPFASNGVPILTAHIWQVILARCMHVHRSVHTLTSVGVGIFSNNFVK